jgi:hypothetical protein
MEHYAAPFPAKFVVLYDSLGINRDIIRTTSTVVIRSRYESFPEVNTIECICGPGVARYCKAGAENDA